MTGLELIPEFVSVDAEKELIVKILECLKGVGRDCYGAGQRSRVKRFGYDYTERTRMLEPIPEWLRQLRISFPPSSADAMTVNSITINEYEPGHGIAPHVDSLKFSPVISILSLGGSAMMEMTDPIGGGMQQRIDPRTLIVMSGVIRTDWKHSIIAESVVETRYSIVFRERLL